MKKLFLFFSIISAFAVYPQSFIDARLSGISGTISNAQFIVYVRISDELMGVVKNDQYTFFAGSLFELENGGVTGVEDKDFTLPVETKLFQNYPNPFNPSTTINYWVASTGHVTLKIFDVLGREVVSLVNEEKQSGNYFVQFNGKDLASGFYFYQLRFGNFIDSKKLLLLK